MFFDNLFPNKGGEEARARRERKLSVLSKAVENNKICNSGISIDKIIKIVQYSDRKLNYKGIK